MKRRDFLNFLAAGTVLTAVPFKAMSETSDWNTQKLTDAMEEMFKCHMGPSMSFCHFNSQTGEVMEPIRTGDFKYENPKDGFEKYEFETYACVVEGGSKEDAEARMAKYFYDEFSKVPAGHLIWRLKPHFYTDEGVEYGEIWATREEVEDNLIDFSQRPENVEEDFENSDYRYVKRRYMRHVMRARLSIPDSSEKIDLKLPNKSLFNTNSFDPIRI